MNSFKNQKICLKEFISEKVLCYNDSSKSYNLKIIEDKNYYHLFYYVPSTNQHGTKAKRCFGLYLPKYITRNLETFEVIGLLQAEMGKQLDGKIVFCNHEYQLVEKVINWFEREFNFSKSRWKWYIKVNINEPYNENKKKEIEDKVVKYWTNKIRVSIEMAYPKKVSYIKNTRHKELKSDDYGTLIIERKFNLFSQIIKRLVKIITYNLISFNVEEIRSYMKAILAGESNVEIHLRDKRYRVFITAKDPKERKLFQDCLKKLGIGSIQNGDYKSIIISKKQNNLELLKQGLMKLSPEKYDKFLKMMNLYQDLEISQYVK